MSITMLPERMPPGGAKELRRSAEGRRYLAKLQKRHRLDLLQPTDPMFMRVHGAKVQRDQKDREREAAITDGIWEERKVRAAVERFNRLFPGMASVTSEKEKLRKMGVS